jgi:hypothetical protein
MRDDDYLILWFTIGLLSVTLYLMTRQLASVEDRLAALTYEFYRPPHPITVDADAS